MPSVAKKLVVVQSNEPAQETAPIESTRPEELRLLEMVRDTMELDGLVAAAIEASARARLRRAQ